MLGSNHPYTVWGPSMSPLEWTIAKNNYIYIHVWSCLQLSLNNQIRETKTKHYTVFTETSRDFHKCLIARRIWVDPSRIPKERTSTANGFDDSVRGYLEKWLEILHASHTHLSIYLSIYLCVYIICTYVSKHAHFNQSGFITPRLKYHSEVEICWHCSTPLIIKHGKLENLISTLKSRLAMLDWRCTPQPGSRQRPELQPRLLTLETPWRFMPQRQKGPESNSFDRRKRELTMVHQSIYQHTPSKTNLAELVCYRETNINHLWHLPTNRGSGPASMQVLFV